MKTTSFKTQAKAAPVPEKAIQAALMRRLREAGFLVVRVNSGSHRNAAQKSYFRAYTIENMPAKWQSCGFPDVMAMEGGKVFLFEVKADKGELSEPQEMFQQCAENHGVTVYLVRGQNGIETAMAAVLAVHRP